MDFDVDLKMLFGSAVLRAIRFIGYGLVLGLANLLLRVFVYEDTQSGVAMLISLICVMGFIAGPEEAYLVRNRRRKRVLSKATASAGLFAALWAAGWAAIFFVAIWMTSTTPAITAVSDAVDLAKVLGVAAVVGFGFTCLPISKETPVF